MRRILFTFLLAFNTLVAVSQVNVIHGTGPTEFYVLNESGIYQIQSSEVWINSDGSQTFSNPTYVPIASLDGPDGNPLSPERMSCAVARLNAQQATNGSAECGPTNADELPGGHVRHSCRNQDAYMCRLTFTASDGRTKTIWGFETD